MLSTIRKCLATLAELGAPVSRIDAIPPGDPATYDMLCRGDSVGVFQVESRAQMAMLPRLRPRCYYDLVIQVAIVRPGPIQGDMVHPFLRRRAGSEPVTYPSDAIRAVLERTLGVPIFQEQVIKLAMVAAGFSGGEADRLRRAMASWGKSGNLLAFERKLIEGMTARGYDPDFARRLFEQIKGFGGYGFPESHAASFALLVYVSAWLKCHYPTAFYCALLNSQPMGFYSPSQLVQDARRHQVEVRPVDVAHSRWDHVLEAAADGRQALRLGLRLVRGLHRAAGERIAAARLQRPFAGLEDLARRAGLDRGQLAALAAANALQSFSGHRHQAQWDVAGLERPLPLTAAVPAREPDIRLPAPATGTDLLADYRATGLTLGPHPMALLRAHSLFHRCARQRELPNRRNRSFVRIAGLVTDRQRPGTASGVIFLTLEDETGNINVIVWRDVQTRCRSALLDARLLLVKGVLEQRHGVCHVIAGDLIDHSVLLADLAIRSRDFH
jgi:error-prone DNA polymerase